MSTGSLDDTYDRLVAFEAALDRFEETIRVHWAAAERAFEPLDSWWHDAARDLLDEDHEGLQASLRELIEVEGPARLAFVREKRGLLESYLRHRS